MFARRPTLMLLGLSLATLAPTAAALPEICTLDADARPCNTAATCINTGPSCGLAQVCTHTLGAYGPCVKACTSGVSIRILGGIQPVTSCGGL